MNNLWLAVALPLTALLAVLGVACARAADPARALVQMQLSGVVGTMLLIVLAEGFHRSIYFELPLVFALMSFVGMVSFLRLRGRRL